METKKTTSEAYALKSLVLREGVPAVKKQLGVYVKKLKEGEQGILCYGGSCDPPTVEFSQGMVLPRQNSSNNPPEKVAMAVKPQDQQQVCFMAHVIFSWLM